MNKTLILTPHPKLFQKVKGISAFMLNTDWDRERLRGFSFDKVFIAKEYYYELCELPYGVLHFPAIVVINLKAKVLESNLVREIYGY